MKLHERPMKITSLGLHITNRCNAKCLHCAFNCGPKFKGFMGLKEVEQYLTDARALNIEIVCVTGGEPMLYPNLVKKIISKCNTCLFMKTGFSPMASGHMIYLEHVRLLENLRVLV